MIDVEHQPGRRVLPGVHDLEHHTHFLGRRTRDAGSGTEHLEHVTGRPPFGAAPVDEQDLLRPSQLVDVPLSHEPALEAPLHRGRPYESRVLERLERHRQVAVVDSAELRSEEHTSELQSQSNLVCRLLLEKKKKKKRKVRVMYHNS